MFCTKCGSEVPDSAKFCTKCGAPVQSEQPQQQEATYQDPAPQVEQQPAYQAPQDPSYQAPQAQSRQPTKRRNSRPIRREAMARGLISSPTAKACRKAMWA